MFELVEKIDRYDLVYFDVGVSIKLEKSTIGYSSCAGFIYDSIDQFMEQEGHSMGVLAELISDCKYDAIEQIGYYKKQMTELANLLERD